MQSTLDRRLDASRRLATAALAFVNSLGRADDQTLAAIKELEAAALAFAGRHHELTKAVEADVLSRVTVVKGRQ